jgi:hypothetical protein
MLWVDWRSLWTIESKLAQFRQFAYLILARCPLAKMLDQPENLKEIADQL